MTTLNTSRNRQDVLKNLKQVSTVKASNFDMSQLKLNLKLQLGNINNAQSTSSSQKIPVTQITTSRNNVESLNSTHRTYHIRNSTQQNLTSRNNLPSNSSNVIQSPNLKGKNTFFNPTKYSKPKSREGDNQSQTQSNQNSFTNTQINQRQNQTTFNPTGSWVCSLNSSQNNQVMNNEENGVMVRNSSEPRNIIQQISESKQLLHKNASCFFQKQQNQLPEINQTSQGNLTERIFQSQKDAQYLAQMDVLQEENLQKVKEKYNSILKKRDKIVHSYNSNPNLSEATLLINQFFTIYNMALEETEQRWVLIPKSENSLFSKLIEGEFYLHKILHKLMEQIQQQQTFQQQSSEEIRNLVIKELSLKGQINNLIEQVNDPKLSEDMEKGIMSEIRQNRKENKELNFENIQLLKFSKDIAEKLEYLESDSDIQNLKNENNRLKKLINEQQNIYQQNLFKKDQVISISNSSIHALKSQLKKAEQDIITMKQYYDNQIKFDMQIRDENESLKEQLRILRERFNMLNEDMIGKTMRITDMKLNISQNINQLKRMKEKIDKLTVQKITFVDPPERHEFKEEKGFFNSIQNMYGRNIYFQKQSKIDMSGFNNEQIERNTKKYDKDKDDQSKNVETNINLSGHKYNLPQFYCFIQDNYSSLVNQMTDAEKIPFTFIAAVRGILDSKFNEYLLNPVTSAQNLSSFADFTYSWLTSFEIDKDTRKIVRLDKSNQSADSLEMKVAQFYLTLNNPLLSKLWEFITFRDFLNEEIGQEELYFYLFCRNSLFKGSQLEMSSSTFEIVNYIKSEEAEVFLRNIMVKFDPGTVEYLLQQLRNKMIFKGKSTLIDIQLVLRLLLQYIKTDRLQRYRLIKSLFYSQKCEEKDGQFSLNFTAFKKIFEGNFRNTTELEKAQIFRECYCVGKGIVNHDSFFVVCSENGFFIKQLKLLLPDDFPVYNQKTKAYEPKYAILAQNLEAFQKFYRDENTKKTLQMVMNYMESQGLETQLQKYQLFLEQANEFNQKLTIYDLKGRDYLLYLQDYFSDILSSIMLKFLHKQKQIDKSQIVLVQNNLQQSFITNFATIANILENQKKKKYALQNQKVIKFQRWIKRKISKWYGLLNSILLTKLKTQLNIRGLGQSNRLAQNIVAEEEMDSESDEKTTSILNIKPNQK